MFCMTAHVSFLIEIAQENSVRKREYQRKKHSNVFSIFLFFFKILWSSGIFFTHEIKKLFIS
jgi:hypothetical protein